MSTARANQQQAALQPQGLHHHHWHPLSTQHDPKLEMRQAMEPGDSTDGCPVATAEREERARRARRRQFEPTRRTFRGERLGCMSDKK